MEEVSLCDMRHVICSHRGWTIVQDYYLQAKQNQSCKRISIDIALPSSSLPLKMVRACSLKIVTVVLLALASLRSIALAAHFEPICDRTAYGLPSYQACNALLFGTDALRSGSIFSIDGFEHGFMLPFFAHKSQFTDWLWRHRVGLPEVWRNRRFPIFRMALKYIERRNTAKIH